MKRNSYSEKGQYHEGERSQKTDVRILKLEDLEPRRKKMHEDKKDNA